MKRRFIAIVAAVLISLFIINGWVSAVDAGNLLPNPGFEAGFNERGYPIGWRGSHNLPFGEEFQLVESPKRSGQWALKITYPENHTGGLHIRTDEILSPLPVKPGEVYEATAWAFNSAGNRIVMMVVFLDADNREIPGSGRTVSLESDSWTQISVTSRPAPLDSVQVRVMFWQNEVTKGSFTYVDDVQLVKVQ